MSANDKLAATFGPGRATPTPTLETRIAEVLAAHSIGAFSGDSTACQCDRTWRKNADHRKHLTEAIAAALAPVIAEVRKDERHHVIQDIREQCEYEPPQIGDYGRVELEGYITITNPELDAIENGAGFDRMCMSVTEWETGVTEAQAGAFKSGFDDAHNQHTRQRTRRNLSHPPIAYTNPYRSNDE